jgi:catechol 2,3-dioxygenase-like lactoylglutathione lyase family enzyme
MGGSVIHVKHIDHVAIAVKDIHASAAWYQEMFGLERRFDDVWGDEPPVMVCAGDTCLALFPTEGHAAPPPGRDAVAMRHFAFVTDRANFEAARDSFDERGIEYQFADHEVCHSLYISDPDGHRIELTTYELG